MNAMRIVIGFEFIELSRQVGRVPEKRAVKQLAPNRTDQALDEWMGDRRIGDGLDLLDFTHAQVGQPPVKTEQRIVIGTNALRHRMVLSLIHI